VEARCGWSRGDEAEDGRVDAMGCIGLFYPNFAIFVILGHKSSLVISFPINRTPRVGGEASIHLGVGVLHVIKKGGEK
jgi:hypothetical protein